MELPQEQLRQEKDRLARLKNQNGDIRCEELKSWLQEVMWKNVQVVRQEGALKQTMVALSDYEEKIQKINIECISEIISVLELQNLFEVGKAICAAALYRRESRGSHYRQDYPDIDSLWEKRILLQHKDEKIQIIEESHL
jgi:succinate dehydrogenase/fumarate reductase flavoprotein subunit